ncbi:hypothetical protein VTH06DRAFT_2880 [Thermothelomyces fergusii]
MRLDMSL